MSSTPSPSTTDRVRLTISVAPEVHAAFSRLAEASGMSLGRSMGEWLEDTLDAVLYTADLVEKARAAPKLVMREIHAYAQGVADETGAILAKVRKGTATPADIERLDAPRRGLDALRGSALSAGAGRPGASLPSDGPPRAGTPPRLVIRGGKSPGKGKRP